MNIPQEGCKLPQYDFSIPHLDDAGNPQSSNTLAAILG